MAATGIVAVGTGNTNGPWPILVVDSHVVNIDDVNDKGEFVMNGIWRAVALTKATGCKHLSDGLTPWATHFPQRDRNLR
jgi:hypothetical protein